MSLYLEGKVDALSEGTLAHLDCQWNSQADRRALAVVRSHGEVQIVNEEGLPVGPNSTVHSKDMEVTCIAWHPTEYLLAIGWNNGGLSFWSEHINGTEISDKIHNNAVCMLLWSGNGEFLASADKSGQICLSQSSMGLDIEGVCSCTTDSQATHIVFFYPNSERSVSFIFGTESGSLYVCDDAGQLVKIGAVGAAIRALYNARDINSIVVVSVQSVLFVYRLGPSGTMKQVKKVKLSLKGDGTDLRCTWGGHGLLLAANKEHMVRGWDVNSDESFVLSLEDPKHMAKANDLICTVSYNPKLRTLIGGTAMGRVVMWSFSPCGSTRTENDWIVLPPINTCFDGEIISISIGPGSGIFSIALAGALSILMETFLHCRRDFDLTITQISADKLIVQTAKGKSRKLSSTVRIKGLCIGDKVIVVWGDQKVEVNEIIDNESVKFTASFAARPKQCAVQGQSVYIATQGRIDVVNFQGTVKKVLSFIDVEGDPQCINICGDYLASVTSKGILKLWEIGRREPRIIVPGKKISDGFNAMSCAVNKTGLHVAILSYRNEESSTSLSHSKFVVYDVDVDKFDEYDFGPKQLSPTAMLWDAFDPRLMFVVSVPLQNGLNATEIRTEASLPNEIDSYEQAYAGSYATGLFITSETGILYQDSFPIADDILIGCETPFIFFIHGQTKFVGSGGLPHIEKRIMRDFAGLEDVDDATKKDLLTFSFQMALGNMDEAYRAVRSIDSPAIWKNMARMCVLSRRLDVAAISLGNMGCASGGKRFRETAMYPEKEARLACIAIELGMLEEAERLYRDCGRYDLLSKMQVATGLWDAALQTTETYNRIHLKTLRYEYAQHLENIGEIGKAIKEYESSGSETREVPRMLMRLGRIDELGQYIQKSKDPRCKIWWGRFNEGRGKSEQALQSYTEAGDYGSCVKIHCFLGDLEKARSVCDETQDLTALYFFGQHLENIGDPGEASIYFTKARRFNHALRIAKENGQTKEVFLLALQSPSALQADAAQYLEDQQIYDKAVLLYQKAGDVSRALDLCFKTNQFEPLSALSRDMGPSSPPGLVDKCVRFLISSSHFDKAVQLLINVEKIEMALDLCIQHSLPMTDEMAEKMTPSKRDESMNSDNRLLHLKKMAKYLASIGSYQMATKKFTQAGDKLRAMKCLLKSNDTAKIIYYASMTKKKEIFVLAANYLQNLDWHSDPELSRTIIQFYTKAGAFDSLATFFDSCAQIEIEEFRDYEKALLALKESLKQLEQVIPPSPIIPVLTRRIALVANFVEARALSSNFPQQMVQLCMALVEQEDLESAVHVGDVYAMLIEYYHTNGEKAEAQSLLRRLLSQKIDPSPYIKASTLKDVYGEIEPVAKVDPAHQFEEDIEEDIQIGKF